MPTVKLVALDPSWRMRVIEFCFPEVTYKWWLEATKSYRGNPSEVKMRSAVLSGASIFTRHTVLLSASIQNTKLGESLLVTPRACCKWPLPPGAEVSCVGSSTEPILDMYKNEPVFLAPAVKYSLPE